jgi:hypothetical protein
MALDTHEAAWARLDAEREERIQDFLEGAQDGSLVTRRGRRRRWGEERAEVSVCSPSDGEIRYPWWVH